LSRDEEGDARGESEADSIEDGDMEAELASRAKGIGIEPE